MNYYIADLHLYHENVMKYDHRPFETIEEMHREIKERWNAVIHKDDTVYILGDITLRAPSDEVITFLKHLKGKKILIKGNHDRINNEAYMALFVGIYDYLELNDSYDGMAHKVILSHYPIWDFKDMRRGTILLYGHCHNSISNDLYKESLQKLSEIEGSTTTFNAINVGCMMEYMDYTPRTLKELLTI